MIRTQKLSTAGLSRHLCLLLQHIILSRMEWFKKHFPAQFVAEYIAQTDMVLLFSRSLCFSTIFL